MFYSLHRHEVYTCAWSHVLHFLSARVFNILSPVHLMFFSFARWICETFASKQEFSLAVRTTFTFLFHHVTCSIRCWRSMRPNSRFAFCPHFCALFFRALLVPLSLTFRARVPSFRELCSHAALFSCLFSHTLCLALALSSLAVRTLSCTWYIGGHSFWV